MGISMLNLGRRCVKALVASEIVWAVPKMKSLLTQQNKTLNIKKKKKAKYKEKYMYTEIQYKILCK